MITNVKTFGPALEVFFYSSLIFSLLLFTSCGLTEEHYENVISGVVSKGPVNGGTVTIYALNSDGSTGRALGSTLSSSVGKFSLNIKDYSGNILVKSEGGQYRDEATGTMKAAPALRAAATGISGNMNVAVTPFTEAAVITAGTLTNTKIKAANILLMSLTGGADIIKTMPADPTSSLSTGSTKAEKEYGLMLAAVSQMAFNDNTDVFSVISSIAGDMRDDEEPDNISNDLAVALMTFISSENNLSGISINQTDLDDELGTYITGSLTYIITCDCIGTFQIQTGDYVTIDPGEIVEVTTTWDTGEMLLGVVAGTVEVTASDGGTSILLEGEAIMALYSSVPPAI